MICLMSAMTIQMPQRRKVPRDTFDARLVALRHDLGLTQQEAADAVGVKRASWAVWEKGSIPRNQAEVAKKIADTTGYDLRWLLYGTDNPSPDGHTNGRLEVRVLSQEQEVHCRPNRYLRLVQTAA